MSTNSGTILINNGIDVDPLFDMETYDNLHPAARLAIAYGPLEYAAQPMANLVAKYGIVAAMKHAALNIRKHTQCAAYRDYGKDHPQVGDYGNELETSGRKDNSEG